MIEFVQMRLGNWYNYNSHLVSFLFNFYEGGGGGDNYSLTIDS